MRILQVHNRYQQIGGEDAVVNAEKKLLEEYCNEVCLYEVTNDTLKGPLAKLRAALDVCYSKRSREQFLSKIREFSPDIVHVHNFFPILTPSIYDACLEAGVPVVQTLHNFRSVCPGALLLRDGAVCNECIGRVPLPAILHRCYRKSFLGSLAVARMVDYHRRHGTWRHKVDSFIVLTEFARSVFETAGFPRDKIITKPNFSFRSAPAELNASRAGALFVGRLSPEKGIATLLDAWQKVQTPITILGDGVLRPMFERYCLTNIKLLGHLPPSEVDAQMSKAAFLVMPSLCYEGFPMALVEAFASGLPVIASRLGSMAEIIEDGFSGLLFDVGNASDLAEKVNWAAEHPLEMSRMGHNARLVYQKKYTSQVNYAQIAKIYASVAHDRTPY